MHSKALMQQVSHQQLLNFIVMPTTALEYCCYDFKQNVYASVQEFANSS
jgi:hypothetical protein